MNNDPIKEVLDNIAGWSGKQMWYFTSRMLMFIGGLLILAYVVGCCSDPKITYVSPPKPVEITCVGCDSVPSFSKIDQGKVGYVRMMIGDHWGWVLPQIPKHDGIDSIYFPYDVPDSLNNIDYTSIRVGKGISYRVDGKTIYLYIDTIKADFLKQLDDSIALIRKQNRWLDSLNHYLDTVKIKPTCNCKVYEQHEDGKWYRVGGPKSDTVEWKPYWFKPKT